MKIKEFRHSGTINPAVSERELRNRAVARRAAAEGFVLLKNDGTLPLAAGSKIALFGSGAGHTIKGGTGSGDVNERSRVSVFQGLKDAGFVITSEQWIKDYDDTFNAARQAWKDDILKKSGGVNSPMFFPVYAENAFRMPSGRPVESADIGDADIGIYVISRVAGEGADRKEEKGDYYLTVREEEDLAILSRSVQHVIVLLNTGAQLDLAAIHAIPNIAAILDIKQPGMEGGNAVADVLSGRLSPSGCLTSTWAKRYADFPNASTFSHQNGNVQQEFYTEGIYVGYRYFDSFGIAPDYPFGWGLSYTEFALRCEGLRTDGSGAFVSVEVRNTGSRYSGKCVVQLYAACPQSGLPKEFKRLVAFAKSKELAPGATERIDLHVPAKMFASFDESRAAWVVEQGRYCLLLGTSSASCIPCGVLAVAQEHVIEQVAHVCPLAEPLEQLCRPDEAARTWETSWQRRADELGLKDIPFAPSPEQLAPRTEDDIDREAAALAAKIPCDKLIPLLYGEAEKNQNALGAAGIKVPGAAGESYGGLEPEGIPGISLADGPAGLRLINAYEVDRTTGEAFGQGIGGSLEGGFFAEKETHPNTDMYYQYCTAFPVGTLLAQTWNCAVIEEVGKAVSEEMEEFNVAWWLAPGMNIHRNPLCGRNFEYFAEDPLLSGLCAAAMTKGVQSGRGTGTTIKHFACNNQEDNRLGSDSIVGERALRELYLRGFEIAVKTCEPMAIMTSYNKINGLHTANSADLCTQVARKEWGFRGIFMTDWMTTASYGGSIAWKCTKAGNDIIMPGIKDDEKNLREAFKEGTLSEADIRACATRLIDVILRTNAFDGAVSYLQRFSK